MGERLQIVIVSDFGEVNGGAAKVAIASACGLADRGIEVVFVAAIGPVSPRLERPGIEVHGLGLEQVWARASRLGAALAGIWNAEAADRLRRVLGGVDPSRSIVHVHQWTKAFSPSAFRAARDSGLPSVVSMHDYFLACPNGNYFVFPQARPCSHAPLSCACVTTDCDSRSYAHKAVRLVRQVAQRRALGSGPADRLNVIHVSDFARAIAAPLLPPATRHFTVQNPVEIERRPPVAVERNRDFVFIGRFTPEKQAVPFAAAAARAGVPATFLGDGPDADAIRTANPRATVLPWGSSEAVERVLAGARALVFPSAWYETSGLVVAEALARGVPAVVSTATGARDLIRDGVNGLLCPPGDAAALAGRLRVLSRPEAAARLGRNAYAMYWEAPLSVAAHVDRLCQVYNAVLGCAARRRAEDDGP